MPPIGTMMMMKTARKFAALSTKSLFSAAQQGPAAASPRANRHRSDVQRPRGGARCVRPLDPTRNRVANLKRRPAIKVAPCHHGRLATEVRSFRSSQQRLFALYLHGASRDLVLLFTRARRIRLG